jgi:PAS domain S-box-containing protein
MLDRGMALWDQDGKPCRMVGYQTDLTERKRLEAELRKSHQRLFSILDNIGEGVIVSDKDGNVIIFNKRAEDILGVGSINAPWEEWSQAYGVFLADGVTYFPAEEMPLYKALHGESADNVELYIKNEKFPFGRWIAITGRPVMDDKQQEIIAGVIVFRDITARKQLEKLFVDNEKRLKVILASIGDGIIILNHDEHVLLFNRKAEEILGTGPKDLNLKKWPGFYGIYEPEGTALIPAEELPMVKAFNGEQAGRIEIMIRNKNVPEGKHIYLAARPIKDNKGNTSGCIVDFQDITEQRKLEEYVQEIQEQVNDLINQQRPSV